MQLAERPHHVVHGESTAFPVCHRFVISETVHVDRDINVFVADPVNELLKQGAPVVGQNCAAPPPLFGSPFIGPRVNAELSGAFGPAVAKDLPRPPTFEIPAAPDVDGLDMRQLQRPIDPAAASPFRRADVPVRVIVEGNEDLRLGGTSDPKRGQMMKITGTVEDERGEA